MIEAALRYADRGFPVFPCRETSDKSQGSKAPYLPGVSSAGAHDGGHWLASAEAAKIDDWWRRWPQALVGFPTGLRSSTVVIDLDPKEAALLDMARALRLWCGGDIRGPDRDSGEFILPAAVSTQSGGLHLYYLYPEPATLEALGAPHVGNRANLFRRFIDAGEAPAALAHIDVRGEGGYVIAPPSVMANGARYAWLWAPTIAGEGRFRLPDMPHGLLELVCGKLEPKAVQQQQQQRADKAHRFAAREISDARVRAYVEKSIAGILKSASAAREGERNTVVFWAACRLGEFVRGGAISRGHAQGLLLAHLPAGVSPAEHKIQKTIESGLDNVDNPAFSPEQLGERA